MRTALDLPHGIHDGVPDAVYHQRVPGLVSKHALDLVRRSPAHYKAWVDGAEEKDSEAYAFGRAFHCALLEPARFETAYVVEPAFGDCRKPENKKNRDAWREANKGAVWLPYDEYRASVAMAAAIRRHTRASRLLSGGRAEVTARWRDEVTGLECKARADYYVPELRTIIDVKTADNASDGAFAKAAASYGYHRQHALYVDGFRAAGAPVDHFVFIVVEKGPPFAVGPPYVLSGEDVAKGRASVRKDMETLADRIERDVWDAYPEEIQVLTLPAWAA